MVETSVHTEYRRPRGPIAERALMVTDRERLAFLDGVPLLDGVDHATRRSLTLLGRDTSVEGRAVLDLRGVRGTVYMVRAGELLVCDDQPRADEWIDRDGLMRDASGDRVSIDPVTGARVVDRLMPGDLFGDSALAEDAARSGLLRAGTLGVELVAFDAVEFHLRLARRVLACTELASLAADEALDLRRVGLYNDLPMSALAAVLRDAREERFRAGDAIVTAGEVGDRFYVVLDGELLVERDGEELDRLGRGDHFGELALLMDAPRAATVRATSRVRCWSVTRAAFEVILRSRLAPASDAAMRDIVDGRGPGGALGSTLATRLRR